MRRPTFIILVVLLVLLVVTTAIQFSLDAPDEPFPGPVSGTPVPPELTSTSPPT